MENRGRPSEQVVKLDKWILDTDDSMLENMTQEPNLEERYDTTTNEFSNEDDLENIYDGSYD